VTGKIAMNSSASKGQRDVPVSASPGSPLNLARRLIAEFGSPVGLYDPKTASWTVRHGAPDEAFPSVGARLVESVVEKGRVTLLHDDAASQCVWLLLPMASDSGPLLAAAGFASALTPRKQSVSWGPVCPEAALKAWGQSVAGQIHDPGKRQTESSVARAAAAEGGQRLFIARLIRRLRISDAPERFQLLATNALRTWMNVEAIAWVPCHHAEPVVVGGSVGELHNDGYRSLLPGAFHKDAVLIQNRLEVTPDAALRQLVAASADSNNSVGWLIAVNPLDGRPFIEADAELLQPVASLIAAQQTNARVYADLKELLFGVIRALTSAIDAKDPYTSGHSERVARIAVRLGEELGMTPNQRGDLYLMGLLHDVGKIGVDDAVLKKTGPLTPEEYRQIQAHVMIGVHILTDLKKLSHLLPGVRHHHESLDGSGYPGGLAGEDIPFEARILAVADSFDAMSSTRPYRRRLTPSQIDEILHKGAGVQWDPRIVDALFACRMDVEMIRQKGLGESLQAAVSDTLGRS
jgi:HD-GYP domain-containing protein (c-di-GMP phosphodiesterase class II)